MHEGSDPPTSESSVNRRSFFRRLTIRGVEKFEQAGQDMADKFTRALGPDQFGVDHSRPNLQPTRYLRPPGALAEPFFHNACTQCGDCLTACPAQCIQVDQSGEHPSDRIGGGYPYIDPRFSPCVVCDELACMKVCPTDALNLVAHASEINMGIAVISDMTCLRGPRGDREDCTICINRCPLGEQAIRLDPHHRVVEVQPGCIGCGVCEAACPTEPASIWIEPHHG